MASSAAVQRHRSDLFLPDGRPALYLSDGRPAWRALLDGPAAAAPCGSAAAPAGGARSPRLAQEARLGELPGRSTRPQATSDVGAPPRSGLTPAALVSVADKLSQQRGRTGVSPLESLLGSLRAQGEPAQKPQASPALVPQLRLASQPRGLADATPQFGSPGSSPLQQQIQPISRLDVAALESAPVKALSAQEKLELWHRYATDSADEKVTQRISPSNSPPRSDSDAPPAHCPKVASPQVAAKVPKASLQDDRYDMILERMERLERELAEERASKNHLVLLYEGILKEKAAAHQRDVAVLEDMLKNVNAIEGKDSKRQDKSHRKALRAPAQTTPSTTSSSEERHPALRVGSARGFSGAYHGSSSSPGASSCLPETSSEENGSEGSWKRAA